MLLQRFNPRLHTAGDGLKLNRRLLIRSFNPRPHTAGDDTYGIRIYEDKVSIHARTRRATTDGERHNEQCASFNPRPHTAGDWIVSISKSFVIVVSIHARTRRATGFIS